MATQLSTRENVLLAYQHKQPQWIPSLFVDITLLFANPTMERYYGPDKGEDGFGLEWTYVPEMKAPMPTPGKELLKDIADWREVVKFPDVDAVDWEKQASIDAHTDFAAMAMTGSIQPLPNGASLYDDPDKLFMCMVLNGPFERLHALMGMEEALISLISNPEDCYDFFGAMADYKIKHYEKIAKYYNVDIINQHDDYGTNDRMFMSVDTWRALIKPHIKRMVEACHDLGFMYQHHSCGYIEPLMNDFVEIGMDAIDVLQVCNTKIPEMKKRLGDKITFVGGSDNQKVFDIPVVDEEAVRQEYRRVVDLYAPGGSYVLYPSGAKGDFMPYFMDEHFKYGVGFYGR